MIGLQSILKKSTCMIVVVDSINRKVAIELGHIEVEILISIEVEICLSTCLSSAARARPSASGATMKTSSQMAAPVQAP